MHASPPVAPPRPSATATCPTCRWRALCLPAALAGAALDDFESAVAVRLPVPRHARLHAAGAPFGHLYAVLCGEFKTQCAAPAGGMQVTAVAMPGDLLGLDAVAGGRHPGEAVALSDSVVCVLPYPALEAQLAREPALAQRFRLMFGVELARRQHQALWLGSARAPQRLAQLLLDLGQRYAERGGSATAFHLSMSREDIAAFTGLTVESISRLLSAFRRDGLLNVSNRDIVLCDPARLRALAGPPALQPALQPPFPLALPLALPLAATA